MNTNEKKSVSPRWRTIALVAVGVAIGTTLTATPVYSHVGRGLHYWLTHVKPRADVRYVNIGEKASDAEKLDGRDSSDFAQEFNFTCSSGQALSSAYNFDLDQNGATCTSSIASAGSAANADRLDGNDSSVFMRMTTEWKSVRTKGERYPIEIGNPPCVDGDNQCYAQLRCDPGDVLLSGGYNLVDPGTVVQTARPFNANGYDHKYTMVWDNNSTADEIDLNVLCADQ